MLKRIFILLLISAFSTSAFNEVLFVEVEKSSNERPVMRGFGRGQGRGLGLGRPRGQRMGERGPFRDGSGPNPDCPKKKNRDEKNVQEERNDSGRALKHDGTGPNKDGQGPRGSGLGPREECPKK